MRRGLAATVLALVLVPFAWAGAFPHKPTAPLSTQIACGSERRDVKQLLDTDAKKVEFGNVRDSTVKKLGKLTRPAILSTQWSTRPRQLKERRVYRVNVILDSIPGQKLGFKIEGNDNDIHLAVRDASGATMVVEFPNHSCTAGAQARSAMEAARQALVQACGEPSGSFRELKGKATITGVLFFDFAHHQRGKAPNVAELHPVLNFTNATCSKAP